MSRFARSRWTGFKPSLEYLEDRCVPAVDVIMEWNAVMLQANAVDHGQSPPEQPGPNLTARAFAEGAREPSTVSSTGILGRRRVLGCAR